MDMTSTDRYGAFMADSDWESETLYEIRDRIVKADKRYGSFASTHEALGVAAEEWDELREAIRSNKMASIEWECLDLAAVLIRLARDINKPDTAGRSVK